MQFTCTHKEGVVFFENAWVALYNIFDFPQSCNLRTLLLLLWKGQIQGVTEKEVGHAMQTEGSHWVTLRLHFSVIISTL